MTAKCDGLQMTMNELRSAEARTSEMLTRTEVLKICSAAREDLRRSDAVLSLEDAMTEGSSWLGNWKARLYEQVRERGYDSLTAFAEARPTASLVALAEELGKDDIAGVQVFTGLVAEAEQRKQVTRLVRGQFVRELWDCLPDGWPPILDRETRFEVARALAGWYSFTPETHKDRVARAGDTLLANPPPAGWRPLSPDDELLRMLLPNEGA